MESRWRHVANLFGPWTARLTFAIQAVMSGVSHVGAIVQRNLIVGLIVLAAMFGVIIPPAIVPATRTPITITAIVVLLAVFVDGAFIERDKAQQTFTASVDLIQHRLDIFDHVAFLRDGSIYGKERP